MQSIGEILYSTLKKKGLAGKLEENAILKLWPQAVGKRIARQTHPDALRNRTLFVKTISSVWVQQLHFMKEEILQKMNELAGRKVINEIRFSVGHEIVKTKQNESASVKRSYLKDRDKKMIEECTAALPDPELASILKEVMKKEINRRRRIQLTQER